MNYFSEDELKCKCCGVNRFSDVTLHRLNQLRKILEFPIVLNSAYRCEAHNNDIGATQTHASGQAVDIKIRGAKAVKLIVVAGQLGFTGFGINQKGATRFIHLDDLSEATARPRPHIWSYS